MSIGKADMNCVYILQSEKSGRYYIGSTNNLERRLLEHSAGKTQSLKDQRPFKVVFAKEFPTIREARLVERRLKKAKSRVILEKIIADKKIKMGP